MENITKENTNKNGIREFYRYIFLKIGWKQEEFSKNRSQKDPIRHLKRIMLFMTTNDEKCVFVVVDFWWRVVSSNFFERKFLFDFVLNDEKFARRIKREVELKIKSDWWWQRR